MQPQPLLFTADSEAVLQSSQAPLCPESRAVLVDKAGHRIGYQ
ncbi:MAG: hypothetical protein ACLT0Y_07655 [Christensenellales bacterium]